MDQITISVIMAAKDAERTIGLAVTSALAGLRRDDELLVMLDNCSDKTSIMLDRIQDPRLRVFTSNKTLGVSKARNALVRNSRKTHIAVMDSDDIALPWRFWITRRLLRKFDLIFGSAVVFGNALKPFPVIPQVPRRISNDPLEVLFRNPFVHSSSAYRRDLFERVGGYPDSVSEDYCLWLTLLASGATFCRSALPFVLYRVHSQQYSSQHEFFLRAESDPLLRQARESLINSFGSELGDLEDWQKFARNNTLQKGLLARAEVFGVRFFSSK